MASVSVSFTSAVAGAAIGVRRGDSFTATVSGTFSATVYLERSNDGGESWQQKQKYTAPGNKSVSLDLDQTTSFPLFRFRCDSYVSGTAVTTIAKNSVLVKQYQNPDGVTALQINDDGVPVLVRLAQQKFLNVGAKVGATSGAVVASADNKGIMATVPASQTGSTIVMRLNDLKIGATLIGFNLIGNVISAGGTVTVDMSLRSLTSAASGAVDAAVSGGGMTQVSVTANTLLSALNTAITGLSVQTVAGVSYYLLITVTTAASTSVELEGVVVSYNEQ